MIPSKQKDAALIEAFLANGGTIKVYKAAKPVYKPAETLESTDTRRTSKEGKIISHNDCMYVNVGGSVSQMAALSEI